MRISDWSSDVCSSDPPSTAIGGVGQFGHSGVHSGLKHLSRTTQLCIFPVMRQIGTIAANARGDRLACLGMIANSARQAEKLYRPFQVKVFTGNIPWHGGDRKRTRLNSRHLCAYRMPSFASTKKHNSNTHYNTLRQSTTTNNPIISK